MNLSVEEAIQRGRLYIHGTSIFALIGILIVSFILGLKKIAPFWIIPSSIFYAPLLAWIFYDEIAKKWTLWAFKRVEDIHELKRRAFEEKFIYMNEEKFNSTKFFYCNKNKKEWNSILECIKKAPIFIDDFTIQTEEKIFYKSDLKTKSNPTPQIILNNERVHTIFTGFYKWSEIKKEQLIVSVTRNGRICDFYYEHPNGSRILNIDRFNIDSYKFSRLIKIYRGRHDSKSDIR